MTSFITCIICVCCSFGISTVISITLCYLIMKQHLKEMNKLLDEAEKNLQD